MKNYPMIDDDFIDGVCQRGQGSATCRYLILGGVGLDCAKGSRVLTRNIEKLASTFTAQGDNCSGPPNFEAGS